MTIRVTRLRRQVYRKPLVVYVDGRPLLRLNQGQSGDIEGSGAVQELVVKSEGFVDSPPLPVTDPRGGRLLGILVTYTAKGRLFTRATKSLHAELMGDPLEPGTWDPP